MIRLTDVLHAESIRRGCAPLEPFLLGLRMQLWPLFQKQMSENVNSLKALADSGGASATTASMMGSGAFAGMFGLGKSSLSEDIVQRVHTPLLHYVPGIVELNQGHIPRFQLDMPPSFPPSSLLATRKKKECFSSSQWT